MDSSRAIAFPVSRRAYRARTARHVDGARKAKSYSGASGRGRHWFDKNRKGTTAMQVQVNTGNGLDNKESLERFATDFLNDALARFSQEITRVEVQISDEACGKGGATDLRCMMEARLNGHEPVAVNHYGATQDEAFRGAAQRLVHALDHTLGKLDRHQHRDRETIRKEPVVPESPLD
jgi:hypothetical protein